MNAGTLPEVIFFLEGTNSCASSNAGQGKKKEYLELKKEAATSFGGASDRPVA